jgi:hypothetical protein
MVSREWDYFGWKSRFCQLCAGGAAFFVFCVCTGLRRDSSGLLQPGATDGRRGKAAPKLRSLPFLLN